MNEILIGLIKEARLGKNMKQVEVAEKLGVKKNTISNWENGKSTPDIETFVRLCNVYEVDFAKLLENAYSVERELIALNFSFKEVNHIKKYRALDERGQQTVDMVLNTQYELVSSKKQTSADSYRPLEIKLPRVAEEELPYSTKKQPTREEAHRVIDQEYDVMEKGQTSSVSTCKNGSNQNSIKNLA